MKQNILIFVVAVVIVAALVCTGTKPGSQKPRPAPTAQGRLGSVNNVGRTAPDFQLPTLDGKQIRLSDYRGKAVLLNFWATWCGPCKTEMPWLVELQKQYRAKGFEVVGVAMESNPKETAGFAKRVGLNYAIVVGNESVADLYGGLDGLPISFYIDRNGRIVAQNLGLTGRDEIEASIRKALQSPFTEDSAPSPSSQRSAARSLTVSLEANGGTTQPIVLPLRVCLRFETNPESQVNASIVAESKRGGLFVLADTLQILLA